MNPVIVDPQVYDRTQAYIQALQQCKEFLAENRIREPARWSDKITARAGYCRLYGLYDPKRGGTISVNLKISRPPVKTPGFQWTYTGWKADLTAPGILAHEMGHHVDHCIRVSMSKQDWKNTRSIWAAVCKSEPRVSSYEPNASEAFAESMKLFVLNPNLLKEGRPNRYKFLTRLLELQPIHDLGWKSVLQHAHPKIISAAEKWIRS